MKRKILGGVKPVLSDQDGYEIKDAIKQKGIGVTDFLRENGFTQGYINSVIATKTDATSLIEVLNNNGIHFEPTHYSSKYGIVMDFDDLDSAMEQLREKGTNLASYMKKIGKSRSYAYTLIYRELDATWLANRFKKDGINLRLEIA